MGIDLLTGGLGSGKTYDAVRQMINLLKQGRTVRTNIEGINGPDQRKMIAHLTGISIWDLDKKLIYYDDEKDRIRIQYFWKEIEPNDVGIWDECHKYWNSRNWKSACNNETAEWMAESRHKGNDILLITQAQKKLETNIRDIISWRYHYTNLRQFGPLGAKSYSIKAFYDNGDVGFTGAPKRYKKEIFLCYKSVVNNKVLLKNGILKGKNVFKHPAFLALPIVFFLFFFFLFRSNILKTGVFGSEKIQDLQSVYADEAPTPEIIIPEPEKIKTESKKVLPVQPVNSDSNHVEKPETTILGYVDGKKIIKNQNRIFLE